MFQAPQSYWQRHASRAVVVFQQRSRRRDEGRVVCRIARECAWCILDRSQVKTLLVRYDNSNNEKSQRLHNTGVQISGKRFKHCKFCHIFSISNLPDPHDLTRHIDVLHTCLCYTRTYRPLRWSLKRYALLCTKEESPTK